MGSGSELQSSTARVLGAQARSGVSSSIANTSMATPRANSQVPPSCSAKHPQLCIWNQLQCVDTQKAEERVLLEGKRMLGGQWREGGKRQGTGEGLGRDGEEQTKSLLGGGSAGRNDVNEKEHISLLLSPVIHLLGHNSKRCRPGLGQVVFYTEAAAPSCHLPLAGGGAPEAAVPRFIPDPHHNSLLLFQGGPSLPLRSVALHGLSVVTPALGVSQGRLWLRGSG